MENTMTYVQPFFDWLLQTTLSASVVIGLILVAQRVLGGKLGPRWRHALWLVLLIRLVLPGIFPSQINLLSLVPSFDRQIQQQQPTDAAKEQEASQASQISDKAIPGQKQESDVGRQEQMTPEPGILASLQSKSQSWWAKLRRILPLFWLGGALVIGVYLLMSNFFLWRIVKRERPLLDQKTLELFEECKAQMNVYTLAAIVPSAKVKSPALFGFLRPRLLWMGATYVTSSQRRMCLYRR